MAVRGTRLLLTGGGILILAAIALYSSAPAQQESPGRKLAFLVGVKSYDHAELPDLEFPENDVVALGAQLKEKQGYEVRVLTTAGSKNQEFHRPTAANIRRQLRELLKGVTKRDLIVVGFAGHGIQALGSDESYFCPQDANPTIKDGKPAEPERLVSLGEILSLLRDSGVGAKFLFVDACRTDPNVRGRRGVDHVNVAALPSQTAVLLSCAPGEFSFEHQTLAGGHGVFFYHLLKGLEGEAKDANGNVNWNRLSGYVQEQVPERVKTLFGDSGGEQNPNAIANVIGRPIVLARISTRRIPKPPTLQPSEKPAMKKPESPAPRPATLPTRPTGDAPELLVAPFDESKAKEAQDAWAKHLGTKVEVTNSIGMKLRLVPAGEFQMGSNDGSDDEQPQHRVQITKPYYLGQYEVTQAEFELVMGRNPSGFSKTGGSSRKVSGRETIRFPVERVSWYDAVEFCNKLSEKDGLTLCYRLTVIERNAEKSITHAEVFIQEGDGYRLPTEAEWEYACRAGTTTPFHFGEQSNGRESNVRADDPFGASKKGLYLGRTTGVGDYRPNNFGLFDMHGNAAEWCQDLYGKDYYRSSPEVDPAGPDGGIGRTMRGGSWSNEPRYTRTSARNWGMPESQGDRDVGFRVVRTQ